MRECVSIHSSRASRTHAHTHINPCGDDGDVHPEIGLLDARVRVRVRAASTSVNIDDVVVTDVDISVVAAALQRVLWGDMVSGHQHAHGGAAQGAVF
jgi:hypothetical protein